MRSAMWTCCGLCLITTMSAVSGVAEAQPITSGDSIKISYTSEAPAVVTFQASAGELARIEVEQTAGDASIVARTADGRHLRRANRTSPPEIESIDLVLSVDTVVTLEITPARGNSVGGDARITLMETRPATAAERVSVGAEMALDEGDHLTSVSSAESLREAITRYESARELFAEIGNREMEGVALDSSAWVHDLLGEKRRAIDLYQEALEIRRDVGDKDGEIFTLLGMGLVYNYLGEIDKALANNEHALELARETGNKQYEANLLHNIGGLHWSIDEMQTALDYYRRSLEVRRELDDPRGLAGTLNNIGDVYRRLGDYDRAMEYFENAFSIRTEIGDKRGMAHSNHTMGLVHSARGEWPEAKVKYQQGLDLRRETGDKRGVAFSLGGLSGAYYALGNVDKALEYSAEAIDLWKEMGELRSLGETRWRSGLMMIDLGRLDEAKSSLDEALELSRKTRDRTSEASSLYGLARLHRIRGSLETALTEIEAAISIVESLRGKIASEELRASYLASISSFYDFYISLQMELDRKTPESGFAARALEASERSRARSLLDALSAAAVETFIGEGTDISERERELRRQVQHLEKQVVKLATEEAEGPELALAQTKLDQTLAEYQAVLDKVRADNPRRSELMRPRTLTLAEIQAMLESDTTLLEFAFGQDESFVWVVTTDGLAAAKLPPRATIDELSRELHENLVARNIVVDGESIGQRRTRLAAADAEAARLATTLSETLLGAVSESISSRRLVVVADGALQYLPFSALPDPASGYADPLLVRCEVVSLPSASLIPLLRDDASEKGSRTTSVAIIADPVFDPDDPRVEAGALNETPPTAEDDPNRLLLRSAAEVGLTAFSRLRFSRREAEAIASFVAPERSLLALDFAASLEAIDRDELASSRVVHFATHGILNSRSPELSGLVLSLVDDNGRARAGFLTLGDIYALKLDADLVVLSACQTALGREIRGEGLIGLTRGFMYAGAPRVISSLWQVDDRATAELMKRTYRNLLENGRSAAAALRGAQLELRQLERWNAPYYWAAFTIQGDWQ